MSRLASQGFPGSAALLDQIRGLWVRSIDDDGSLSLSTSIPAIADVRYRVPVEGIYLDKDNVRVHLLLHVVDGYLDELEVLREDSGVVVNSPFEEVSIEFQTL